MVILVISTLPKIPKLSMPPFGTPVCLKGVSSLTAYRAYGETRALVPGVVYEGEPTLLAGAAGCGKTTTAMQISAAVSRPEVPIPLPWGSCKEANQGGLVVYLDFEKRGKLSEERARLMGLDMRGVKWIESPMLADEQGHLYNCLGKPAERLERLICLLRGFAGEETVKMIVLDSWRYLVNTFLGYNENSFVDCTLVWDAVRAVCKEESTAMLVIAHFKKMDTRDRGGLSAAATNVVLAQKLVRDGPCIISLDKSNIVDVTKFSTKEVQNFPNQPMEFQERVAASPFRASAVERGIQEINRVLYSFDGEEREMPWADIVKFRNPSVNERAMLRARTRMQEEGRLFKRPVYGNTCVYSLTNSEGSDLGSQEVSQPGRAATQPNQQQNNPSTPRFSLTYQGPRRMAQQSQQSRVRVPSGSVGQSRQPSEIGRLNPSSGPRILSATQASDDDIEVVLTGNDDSQACDGLFVPETPPTCQSTCQDKDLARLAQALGGADLSGNVDLQHHLAEALKLLRASH